MRKFILPLAMVTASTLFMGCETATPNSANQEVAVRDDARVAVQRLEALDPTLSGRLQGSYAYAIFPDVGQAAVGIGGASGKGVVFENNKPIGRVTLDQASIGIQLGGDTFAELVLFQDQHALNALENNSIEFGGDANATILKAGAAGATNFVHGVQVYILPKGGLMAGLSVTGQKFHYWPYNSETQTQTTTETHTNQ